MDYKFFFFMLFIVLFACSRNIVNRNNLPDVYERYDVKGSFLLFNEKKQEFTGINPDIMKDGFLPASTFKIPNSIIALEEGILKDEKQVIEWDGTKREIENWNKDHDLESAFKYSVVWFYQNVSRNISKDNYKEYLKLFKYGNNNLSANIDEFWLRGDFRVTAKQQIELLRAVHHYNLPVSRRSLDIVKKIMIVEKTPHYILRAKTGLTMQDGKPIGWWMGYIEKKKNIYYFCNFITVDEYFDGFSKVRIESAKNILKSLGVL